MSEVEMFDVEVGEVEIKAKAEKTENEEIAENASGVSSTMTSEMPNLTTDITLSLHTATGKGLFSGEWAPGKMGLRQFGRHIHTLWEAFEQQDPYAEWQLLKIFESLQQLKAVILEQEKRLNKQMRSLRGFQIKAFRNVNPVAVSLTSVNSLILLAANIIAQTDYLTRLILTLKQLGVAPLMPQRLQELCEELQKIFVLSQAWEKTDITRQEMLDKTKKAQKLEKQWGQIPEEILYQRTTLPFLLLEE